MSKCCDCTGHSKNVWYPAMYHDNWPVEPWYEMPPKPLCCNCDVNAHPDVIRHLAEGGGYGVIRGPQDAPLRFKQPKFWHGPEEADGGDIGTFTPREKLLASEDTETPLYSPADAALARRDWALENGDDPEGAKSANLMMAGGGPHIGHTIDNDVVACCQCGEPSFPPHDRMDADAIDMVVALMAGTLGWERKSIKKTKERLFKECIYTFEALWDAAQTNALAEMFVYEEHCALVEALNTIKAQRDCMDNHNCPTWLKRPRLFRHAPVYVHRVFAMSPFHGRVVATCMMDVTPYQPVNVFIHQLAAIWDIRPSLIRLFDPVFLTDACWAQSYRLAPDPCCEGGGLFQMTPISDLGIKPCTDVAFVPMVFDDVAGRKLFELSRLTESWRCPNWFGGDIRQIKFPPEVQREFAKVFRNGPPAVPHEVGKAEEKKNPLLRLDLQPTMSAISRKAVEKTQLEHWHGVDPSCVCHFPW